MCGIFAIYSNNYSSNNILELINGLKLLEHRGLDGYGISGILNDNIETTRKKDKISNINIEDFKKIYKSCLGHVRYSTSGKSLLYSDHIDIEQQPLDGYCNDIKNYTLAHNGNIPNIPIHDTSYLNNLISSYDMSSNLSKIKINFILDDELDIETKLINIMTTIPASYSIVILMNNSLYVMRDRFGIRPLCLGEKNDNYYVASENYAFSFDENIKFIRDVYPGEILKINENGIKTIFKYKKSYIGLCSFELLYFLNENSCVDGYYIKGLRENLGNTLACKDNKYFNSKDYIVIGIPNSGIAYAKSYAKFLNLKYEQLITKADNIGRSFIVINDEKRKETCKKKFIYNETDIYGKNIIIVDDSIVRGNVIKSIIENLQIFGAKEIHVRIPSPPVIDICELGICIQNKNELLMNNNTIKNICKNLNINSLKYLELSDLSLFPINSYNQCFSGYIDPIIKNFNI